MAGGRRKIRKKRRKQSQLDLSSPPSPSDSRPILKPLPLPMTLTVVITLSPVMAAALCIDNPLHSLQALAPTPINTYEYWQRPRPTHRLAISIIIFQVWVGSRFLLQRWRPADHSRATKRRPSASWTATAVTAADLFSWRKDMHRLILLAPTSIS